MDNLDEFDEFDDFELNEELDDLELNDELVDFELNDFELNDDFDEKKKQRIINKSKKQQIGIILEELYDIFPNACSFYNNSLNDELIDNENVKNKEITFNNKPKLEDINLLNEGIIYEKLLLYNIMAFQEYVNKTDKIINDLTNKYNDMEDKFNKLLNKLNLTI